MPSCVSHSKYVHWVVSLQAVAHNRRVHAREDDDLDGDDSAMMRSALNALWTKLKGLVRTGTGEALAEAVNCIALKSLIFKVSQTHVFSASYRLRCLIFLGEEWQCGTPGRFPGSCIATSF